MMFSSLRNTSSTPLLRSQKSLFRRVIVPWYDTEPICYFTMVFMAGVILFSLSGIFEANASPEYKQYLWVPILLLIMSIVVFISTIMRLLTRRAER